MMLEMNVHPEAGCFPALRFQTALIFLSYAAADLGFAIK